MSLSQYGSITASPPPSTRPRIHPSNIRLPVALPSPRFDGFSQPTITERFPAFQDTLNIRRSVPPPKPHCTLHCDHRICRRMMYQGHGCPNCQCVPNEEKAGVTWYRPAMDFEELDLISIADAMFTTDPSQEIQIHHDEVNKILAHLEHGATIRAMGNGYLRRAVKADFPNEEECVTLSAVHHFFELMHVYFERTLSLPDHRFVTINQLRSELNVYIWTLLSQWVQTYCDTETRDYVLQKRGPRCLAYATFGAPEAVLELWYECVEDLVGVLVWRDEEVWWRMAEGGVLFCVLLVLFWGIVGVVLVGNVLSHA